MKFLIIITFVLWCFFTFQVEAEVVEGCALDSCPVEWQLRHYQNGGQRYYARYPEGSWERINAFCNQALNTSKECK